MSDSAVVGVVLAAGLGTRMLSQTPKVIHPVAGRPMLLHVLDSLSALDPQRIVVVLGPGMEPVAQAAMPHAVAIQTERRGTGHAVLAARAAWDDHQGDLLVVYGDVPLIVPASLRRLIEARRAAKAGLALLTFRPPDPTGYGRVILDHAGAVERIVEQKDGSAAERAVDLCNSGIMAIDATRAGGWLDRLTPDNAAGEYYLTDIVGFARADGLGVVAVDVDADEVMGVNNRADLAVVEAVAQTRLRRAAMLQGATLDDPASTYFSWDTVLGRDVTIEPHVWFGPGVEIGDGVRIRAFSHIEGAWVGDGAVIGPYARLRPGTSVGARAHVGNFVELKNTTLGEAAKANHLSYLGDAVIGARANIGAGTITCNYDGINKSPTEIGDAAFIGSNSALVAPVRVGSGAVIGAGSVITEDVPDDALALGRARQIVKPGGGISQRERASARRGK